MFISSNARNVKTAAWLGLLLFLGFDNASAEEKERAWRGWRGDQRDAQVDKLPQGLPQEARYRWTYETETDALSGVAATPESVVIIGRDQLDTRDMVTCLSVKDGSLVWQYDYPALPPAQAETRDGRLDYGNSPRATPLIVDDRVLVQSAFGDLTCLSMSSGQLIWSLSYVLDFDAPIPTWGWCSSPLHHDGLIYVQPGAAEASLVAIRLEDGEVQWEAEGGQATYTSPVIGTYGNKLQVITTDSKFWSGFDAKTGKRLWRHKPQLDGEFHVPTALAMESRLAIIGEANGIRLHEFDDSGKLVAKPLSNLLEFNPDTHTPVQVGSKIVGAHNGLWVMSAEDVSKHQEIFEDDLNAYCSIISDGTRFLVLTDSGLLLLYSLVDDQPKQLGRLRLMVKRTKIYAHPAWINDGLIYREGNRVHFVELK